MYGGPCFGNTWTLQCRVSNESTPIHRKSPVHFGHGERMKRWTSNAGCAHWSVRDSLKYIKILLYGIWLQPSGGESLLRGKARLTPNQALWRKRRVSPFVANEAPCGPAAAVFRPMSPPTSAATGVETGSTFVRVTLWLPITPADSSLQEKGGKRIYIYIYR